MKKTLQRLAVIPATGFGLGFSPIAPGTVGTLLGIIIVWFGTSHLSVSGQIIASIILSIVAIPICGLAEKYLGKKDDGRIVADEYMTFPICMIGLPVNPWIMVTAFLTNRFFDIVKPPPARQLQAIHGGFGIVIDDVCSSLMSLAVNWGVFIVVTRYVLNG